MVTSDGSLSGVLGLAIAGIAFAGLSWLVYKIWGPKN